MQEHGDATVVAAAFAVPTRSILPTSTAFQRGKNDEQAVVTSPASPSTMARSGLGPGARAASSRPKRRNGETPYCGC